MDCVGPGVIARDPERPVSRVTAVEVAWPRKRLAHTEGVLDHN